MAVAPQTKSSRIQWDGAQLMQVQLPYTAFGVSAVDNVMTFVAPCDLTLKQVVLRMVASTASANAEFAVGDATASGSYRTAYLVQNKVTNTVEDLDLANAAWVKKTMVKGDVMKVKLKAATAAGAIAGTFVFAPSVTG